MWNEASKLILSRENRSSTTYSTSTVAPFADIEFVKQLKAPLTLSFVKLSGKCLFDFKVFLASGENV